MKNTLMILVLFLCTSLVFPITIYSQINLPNQGKDLRENAVRVTSAPKMKTSYSTNTGEFYFHQLAGNQVVGLYETETLALILEGTLKKSNSGKYNVRAKYRGIPKTPFKHDDNIDLTPISISLDENMQGGRLRTKERGRTINQTLNSPSRRHRQPAASSGFYGPSGAGITGYWKSSQGKVANYIDMNASNKTVYWLSETQNPGSEHAFIFIGNFREIPAPRDEFGNRPRRFYYRITGSYYSIDKFGKTEKYFGQATYEGDWFILKKKKATGSGKNKLPSVMHKERFGKLIVKRILATSTDACSPSPMNIFGEISSKSGIDKLRLTNSNDIRFDRNRTFNHKFRWTADKSTNYEIVIYLEDEDDAFCGGGNDVIDINPEPSASGQVSTASLKLSINIDGAIYRSSRGRPVLLGQLGDEITVRGDCRSGNEFECASITFKILLDEP